MDLTTDYLCLKLKHPFMPGASPLVHDLDTTRQLEDAGASAIVIYSLFEEQLIGEQFAAAHTDQYREVFPEALSMMPDPEDFRLGPDDYLDLVRRTKEAVSVPVIASLNGTTPSSWVSYAKQIEQAGADALELNIYDLAFTIDETSQQIEDRTVELVKAVKDATHLPIAAKLLPIYAGMTDFARRLTEAGADGLVLFNRMYQPAIDLEELEMQSSHPLSHPGELGVRLRWLGVLSPHVMTSLACSGGVHTPEAAIRALMCGADVVQLVSALIRHGPEFLTPMIQSVTRWLEDNEYTSLHELRGSMNLLRCPRPQVYTRASYIETLQAWD